MHICLLISGSFPPANPFLEAASSATDYQKKNQLNFSHFRPWNYYTEEEKGKATGEEVNNPGLSGHKAFRGVLEGLPKRGTVERTLPCVCALSVGAASLVL